MIHSNAASPRRTPHGLTLALLLLLTAGCQDNSDPGGGGSRLIEVVGPSQFAGTPLDTVSPLLAVRITDAGQHPLAGIPVAWATDDGALIPGAGETDAAGVARAAWVLGWRPGTQQARATAAGSDGTALFQAAAEGFRAEHLSTGDGRHQCGIDQSGALFCWGTNEEGQLGNGTTTGSDTPVRARWTCRLHRWSREPRISLAH